MSSGKAERKWKIMRKPCYRAVVATEQREDKKRENGIKTEDDKGRERRGVTTLAETFRDFSGGQGARLTHSAH